MDTWPAETCLPGVRSHIVVSTTLTWDECVRVGKVEQSCLGVFCCQCFRFFCWLPSKFFRREGGGQKPSSIVETTPFLCEISTLGLCLQPSRGPTGYQATWDRIQQDFTALAPRCCAFCVGVILFTQKKIPDFWVVSSCFRSQFWILTNKDERKRANGVLNFRGA